MTSPTIPIHSSTELFPRVSNDEQRALGEHIEKHEGTARFEQAKTDKGRSVFTNCGKAQAGHSQEGRAEADPCGLQGLAADGVLQRA